VAAVWLFHGLGVVDRSRLPGCACGDQVDQVWFLALAHSSLLGGHLSFLTTRVDYPAGINVLDNASLPFLGAVMTPFTALLGPIGALALLVRLSFVLSAAAAFFVLRRLVRSDLAAAVGGALYGFSPYMIHQGANHVFLVFVPLPPIILYLVYSRLAAPTPGRALTGGFVIGALAVVQYFICSEVLVSTVLIAVLTAAVLAGPRLVSTTRARRQDVRRRIGAAVRLGVGVAAVAVPLLAYPAWYALAGPRHVHGPTQAVTTPGIALLSAILPANRALVAGGLWRGWRMQPIHFLGNTGFLGLPLIVACLTVVAVARRSPLARAAGVAGLLAFLLALGPRLVVRHHVTTHALPFALLTHVPVLQDLVPSRLTLYVDLSAAVLVAIGVDRLWALARARAVLPVTGLTAMAGSMALALPLVSFPVATAPVAGAFAGRSLRRAVPANAVVLAYPYPTYPVDAAMLWQAEAGMRWSLVGGYGVRPRGRTGASNEPPPLRPFAVQRLLSDAWADDATVVDHRAPVDPAADSLPALVDRYHVSVLMVDLAGRDPGRVVDMFRHAYGPPRRIGRVDLWVHLRSRLHAVGPDRHPPVPIRLAARAHRHAPPVGGHAPTADRRPPGYGPHPDVEAPRAPGRAHRRGPSA
jgi:hypothetical protein